MFLYVKKMKKLEADLPVVFYLLLFRRSGLDGRLSAT